MPTPVLATKLFIPPPRPNVVLRTALIARLHVGLHRRLTLISAPAGFGKTSLASAWIAGCGRPAAWLSLDEGDSDPTRFLSYLVAALQTVVLQVSIKNGDIGIFVFIIGAVCLYTSFYRTRLIPRWISIWGLIGAVPYLVYGLLHLFDMAPGLDFLQVPLAVQEMVMGVWLIVKGFSPSAIASLPAQPAPDRLLRAA
jgi:hypothetical protein